MHHLIIGYGYVGYYLAKQLLSTNAEVTAVSRQLNPLFNLPHLNHIACNINQPFAWNKSDTILYYLIPPPSEGNEDTLLEQFLHHCVIKPTKVIYFGSSAVYGDQQGKWVNESSPCLIATTRQRRRLHAEQLLNNFCQQIQSDCVLLRIAGIYGANRLPVQAALSQAPLIERDKATYTNHIYVKDLAKIAATLALSANSKGIYNIADGKPAPMGFLQQSVAAQLNAPPAPIQSWQTVWDQASNMKREFMASSKRLDISVLQKILGDEFQFTSMQDAIGEGLKEEGRRI